MNTLLVTPAELGGAAVLVRAEAYRHLFRALRLAAGDTLRVVDGAGRARLGRVAKVGAGDAEIVLLEPVASRESALRLTVWVPLPRPERAAWLVEKLTELGAAGIVWYRSQRAPRTLGAARPERFERVARSALEQCGRSVLPEIAGPVELAELVGRSPAGSALAGFVLDRAATGAAGTLLAAGRSGGAAALVVGPEGGLTEGETSALAAAGLVAVSLGRRTLRLETAALAGAALLLAEAPERPPGEGSREALR